MPTKAQELALKTIKEKFGERAIIDLHQKVGQTVDCIPTGIAGVDIVLGGGVPRGRIVELYGPEGGGKTSLALQVIAQAQKQDLGVVLIDAECGLSVNYANALGVDVERLFISQPDTGEQALSIAEIWMRAGAVGLIVIDSVDALIPASTLEGEISDKHVAELARLMSQAMRMLVGLASKSNTCLLLINQLRTNLQIQGYGTSNEITSGGRALKYYASIRADIRRIGGIKNNDGQEIGARIKIKTVKNKIASPYQQTEADLVFGKGIDAAGDLLELATNMDLIVKSGAWYSYKGDRIGQGKSQATDWLRANPEASAGLVKQIKIAKGILSKEEVAKA
jgi:recombination protein RecA